MTFALLWSRYFIKLLRSSPGHVMNSSSIGVIADLGLTLASIDSAKIRLNAFKT